MQLFVVMLLFLSGLMLFVTPVSFWRTAFARPDRYRSPVAARWSRAYVAVLFFPVLLASCATGNVIGAVSSLTITQGQIDGARATYISAFLSPAAHYRCSVIVGAVCTPRPICDVGQSFVVDQCASADAVKKIQGTQTALSLSLDNLQQQFDTGNNTGLVAAYQAVQNAITAASGLVVAFETKSG